MFDRSNIVHFVIVSKNISNLFIEIMFLTLLAATHNFMAQKTTQREDEDVLREEERKRTS